MFDNMTESQAREEILGLVKEYFNKYNIKQTYKESDSIA